MDPWIPWIAVAAPVSGWALEQWTASLGFSFGFALLPVNGFLTATGVMLAAWSLPGTREGVILPQTTHPLSPPWKPVRPNSSVA